jgi:hypothetical protein
MISFYLCNLRHYNQGLGTVAGSPGLMFFAGGLAMLDITHGRALHVDAN